MGYYGIPCKAAKRVNCLPIKCKITKPMTLTVYTRFLKCIKVKPCNLTKVNTVKP